MGLRSPTSVLFEAWELQKDAKLYGRCLHLSNLRCSGWISAGAGARGRSNSKQGKSSSGEHSKHDAWGCISIHVPSSSPTPQCYSKSQKPGAWAPGAWMALQWRLRPIRDPSCYKRGNTFLFRVRCVHISMTKFVQSSQFKNEVSQQLVIPHIYSKIKVSTNPCRVVQK